MLLRWFSHDMTLDVAWYRVDECAPSESRSNAIGRLLHVAEQVVSKAEGLSSEGILRYLQDVGSCFLSKVIMFIRKVSRIQWRQG